MKSTKAISRTVKATVRQQAKNINRWRRLNVPWKAILKQLDLPCNEKTLANHVRHKGLI